MIVILSPAKTLDLEPVGNEITASEPRGIADADYLAEEIQKLSSAGLKALLGTSNDLTSLNKERYQNWATQPSKQCVLSYDGPAYKSLRAGEMGAEDLDFAQSHVRILSALYGVLKPLDLIKPYRLEMSSKLANKDGKDLYMYWKERICASLQRDLKSAPQDEQFLVNCASKEYAKAVDVKALGCPVYQMSFPGPALHAKAARGAMVRHIVANRVCSPEALKAFKGNGGEWSFDASGSSESEFVFRRDAQKATCANKGSTRAPKRQKKS